MQAIHKKLHSQRGASVLMALGFFLLCGFVAAVILGSATTNAQKIINRRTDQQTYYSVSSAARMIRDSLTDAVFTSREYTRVHSCRNSIAILADDPDENEYAIDSLNEASLTGESGALADLMREGAYQVFLSNTEQNAKSFDGTWEKTFSVSPDSNSDTLDPVDVVMTIDENYTLTFTLSSQEFPDSYQLILSCPAMTPEVSSVTTENESYCTHEVYVANEDGTWGTESQSFPITLYTRTTVVQWQKGTIQKGAIGNAA